MSGKKRKMRALMFTFPWSIPACVVLLLFIRTAVWADDAPSSGPKKYDIIFPVKLFCSRKCPVTVPFQGEMENIRVSGGQKVKEGDLLADYALSPEARMRLRERFGTPRLKDLEIRLAQVSSILTELELLRDNLQRAGDVNADELGGILRRIETREIEKKAVTDRLTLEKALKEDDRLLLKKELGEPLETDRIPQKATVRSPFEGYVVWINPDMKQGSEVPKGTVVFQVGIMDPLTARAEVFESEALKIAPGDRGKLIVESMREKEFDVEVSYVSWVPRSSGILKPSYYTVEMTVQNPDLQLREGLMGSVRFSGSK